MRNIVWIPVKEFCEARYKRYLKKKAFLETCLPPQVYHLTDLDQPYEPGKLLRDVVICDGCNEEIKDEEFLSLEGVLAYDRKCAVSYKIIPEWNPSPLKLLPKNVISIQEWLDKQDKEE